jgi:hypothetical protein
MNRPAYFASGVLVLLILSSFAFWDWEKLRQKPMPAPMTLNITIGAPLKGSLVTDLPFELPEKEFNFQVWLELNKSSTPNAVPPQSNSASSPKNTNSSQLKATIPVFLYENPALTFKPNRFDLEADKPKLIHVTRKPGSASLVEIIAKPPEDYQGIDQTVNFGFKAVLKADLPAEMIGGQRYGFTIKLLDEQGKTTTLRAPAFLRLIGSDVKMRIGDYDAPVGTLDIPLRTGANATPLIEAIPAPLLTGGRGSIQAELHAAEQYVLASGDPMTFQIPVKTWLQYGLAILGGLLNALYSLFLLLGKSNENETGRHFLARIGIALVGGILAVLFADQFALIGIKLDHTSVSAYVALGFIISYFGIDVFLSKLQSGGTK